MPLRSLWRIPNPLRTSNFVVRLRIHFVNAKCFFQSHKIKKSGNYRMKLFPIIALLLSCLSLFFLLFFVFLRSKKRVYVMLGCHIILHLFFRLAILCISRFLFCQHFCIFCNPFYPQKASFFILTQSRIFLGLPQNTTFLLSLGFLSNPLFSRSWDAKRPHRKVLPSLQGLCFFLLIHLSLGCSFLPLEDNLECLFIRRYLTL